MIPRPAHNISRALISDTALRVLYRLLRAGYDAYLVGGGVRDLLLGREPKDFDIATNAHPEEVRQIFRSCRLVGRRFLLAHVYFGQEIIEVATFRAAHDQAEVGEEDCGVMEDGRILRDNVYGTLEQDAWRRDFTVNALYYNLRDFSVVDFGNSMDDLRSGVLRLVGEPYSRYREDPVRMLRAIRFSAKLGFKMAPETEAPIKELSHLIREMPPARLFDEVLKLFLGGEGLQTFEMLRHYYLFGELFPQTEAALEQEEGNFPLTLLTRALSSADDRIMEGKPVAPSFLLAALLWEPVRQEIKRQSELPTLEALHFAADYVIQEQIKRVAIPRRYTLQTREIWFFQGRLAQIREKRHTRLLDHPRFRAAYDFLLLRAASGEDVEELAAYWTQLQVDRGLPVENPGLARKLNEGSEKANIALAPKIAKPSSVKVTSAAVDTETLKATKERPPHRRRYRTPRRKNTVPR